MRLKLLKKFWGGFSILSLENKIIGKIIFASLFKKSIYELNGNLLAFKPKGFTRFLIWDEKHNTQKGEIKLFSFSFGGIINFNSQDSYRWSQSLNISGWKIEKQGRKIISSDGIFNKWIIDFQQSDDILMLSGIFIWLQHLKNYALIAFVILLFYYVSFH